MSQTMKTAEVIYQKVKTLPEASQSEVLDFVEYLTQKLRREDAAWSEMSLANALRGMESDVWPDYDEEALKEH
jgi:hypothetical protein